MEKQQESVQKCENETEEDNNAYSLFLYGVRSPVTRDYYLRRLRIFFNYIKLLPDETMEKKLDMRYTTMFELQKISIDSRKNLNKLREEILDEKNHV